MSSINLADNLMGEDPDYNQAAKLLGELLIYQGIVSPQQVQQALDVQTRNNAFLGQIIVDLGFATSAVIGKHLARYFGVRYVDLEKVQPEPEAVALVSEELVRASQFIPFRLAGETLEIAMLDPLDVSTIDNLHLLTGKRIVPLLTMSSELQRTINDYFDAGARTSKALQELETEVTEEDKARRSGVEAAAASEAPIVRLVDSILESALAVHASDIHFEPQEWGLRVRFRVDGTLIDHAEIPRAQLPAVVARLKVLCVMDITESRRPQDGRMRFEQHNRAYDIRVSSVPTVNGEKIVLRILDKAAVLVPLSKLGFLPEQQRHFEAMIRQPHGMVLVVGPTGSGKSTTLYASLNLLNDSKRNIMTLEDPVEYNVPGLNQVQVNARLGLTFASGLRSFVRQDPDVILVGEIRDGETAEMAVQASLTGHLLLSTLHTSSAIGTMARLTNLGVDPFLIAQALSGLVAQRLVAKICSQCARDYHPDADSLRAMGISREEAAGMRFRKGRGCRSCHNRGYSGRVGVYEVLPINDAMRRLIMRSASEEEMQRSAEQHGMTSLRDSALTLVRAGITTPEEMARVSLSREI